jgi:aminoglycoside 2''-phosphotransferase
MEREGDGSIDLNLSALVTKVREAFPDLVFAEIEIDDRGGDHRVLVLDREYAFRFPRGSDNNLRMELAVLGALQGRCEVPTPRYEFVAPDRSFAGYRFLQGAELTSLLFRPLPRPVQRNILDQMVRLLQVLHALEPERIAEESEWRHAWTARQFIDRGRKRLAMVGGTFSALAEEIENFYQVHERDQAPGFVVLHGDLVEEHLLLSPAHDSLSGVIDFGDVGLGDPADDLKGVWGFGRAAATYLVNRYTHGHSDVCLLERSRRAYIRYRIDRFVERLAEWGPNEAATNEAGVLHELLTKTPY